jgi:hypothetical protein
MKEKIHKTTEDEKITIESVFFLCFFIFINFVFIVSQIVAVIVYLSCAKEKINIYLVIAHWNYYFFTG